MVGTDLTYNIPRLHPAGSGGLPRASPLLKRLRDEGKIGFKTGEGFRSGRLSRSPSPTPSSMSI